jgi:hypothetical protein
VGNCNTMISFKILYYNIIISWEHFRLCGPSLIYIYIYIRGALCIDQLLRINMASLRNLRLCLNVGNTLYCGVIFSEINYYFGGRGTHIPDL